MALVLTIAVADLKRLLGIAAVDTSQDTALGAVLAVVRRLVGYNFGPGVACPRFTLGTIDDGQLAAAGTLITGLVSGNVIAPEEPWIREYLGLPARTGVAG